uniref:WH1 domain-containing protein n=1 Tax=Meloidogyne javanica TaxID=6303 RepID=A0A915MM39_MELJA
MNGHSGLSSIKLVKSINEAIYRIIAIRNIDNKRIVDQVIFQRLKYKEATPSFHQWRNEHKQVIGLSFTNTQEARHFYSGVRQALDSLVSIQQQFVSVPTSNQVDTSTYQDPQNFHNYNCQQQDIYSNGANHVEEVNTCYIEPNNGKIISTQTNGCYENNNQRIYGQKYVNNQGQITTNQQQNNLIRRASQGSNISSSTGGNDNTNSIKPSSSTTTNNSSRENGPKNPIGGKQDLISELADRLNKRKMNCAAEGNNEIILNKPVEVGGTKNCVVNQPKPQQICGNTQGVQQNANVQLKNGPAISQKLVILILVFIQGDPRGFGKLVKA